MVALPLDLHSEVFVDVFIIQGGLCLAICYLKCGNVCLRSVIALDYFTDYLIVL